MSLARFRVLGGDLCGDPGSAVDGAPDLEGPAKGFDAVSESPQAGAVFGVGTADPVVADVDDDAVAGSGDPHARVGRLGVLADIGKALGNDVVGSDLDRLRQPLVDRHVQVERAGSSGGERLQGHREAVTGQDGRIDPA